MNPTPSQSWSVCPENQDSGQNIQTGNQSCFEDSRATRGVRQGRSFPTLLFFVSGFLFTRTVRLETAPRPPGYISSWKSGSLTRRSTFRGPPDRRSGNTGSDLDQSGLGILEGSLHPAGVCLIALLADHHCRVATWWAARLFRGLSPLVRAKNKTGEKTVTQAALSYAGLMLGQRRRRWPNINPAYRIYFSCWMRSSTEITSEQTYRRWNFYGSTRRNRV